MKPALTPSSPWQENIEAVDAAVWSTLLAWFGSESGPAEAPPAEDTSWKYAAGAAALATAISLERLKASRSKHGDAEAFGEIARRQRTPDRDGA